MLYVPFAIFLMNSAFVHADIFDKPYPSLETCMDAVKMAGAKASESLPEGGSVKVGCLPLGEGVIAAPRASQEPTEPSRRKVPGTTI